MQIADFTDDRDGFNNFRLKGKNTHNKQKVI